MGLDTETTKKTFGRGFGHGARIAVATVALLKQDTAEQMKRRASPFSSGGSWPEAEETHGEAAGAWPEATHVEDTKSRSASSSSSGAVMGYPSSSSSAKAPS